MERAMYILLQQLNKMGGAYPRPLKGKKPD
jgi:hypothetical protein